VAALIEMFAYKQFRLALTLFYMSKRGSQIEERGQCSESTLIQRIALNSPAVVLEKG